MSMEAIKTHIRDIENFPKAGITFKDITPLLKNPKAFNQAVELMAKPFMDSPPTAICAAEARGFLFGVPLALKLGASFIPIRKPGKLPYKTSSLSYDLEYGQDTLELHADALSPEDRVLMVDDLLATGGTMAACCQLVEGLGATIIGIAFLIELTFLNGKERLAPWGNLHAVIQY